MVIELDQALKEVGPSGQMAPVMADHDARFDKLETKINPGLAAVKARIAMLEGMNAILIDGMVAPVNEASFA
jgi:hypothetical protein